MEVKSFLQTVLILIYDAASRNYKSLRRKKIVSLVSLYHNFFEVGNEELLAKRRQKGNVKLKSHILEKTCLRKKVPPIKLENVKIQCYKNEKYNEYVLFLCRDEQTRSTSNTVFLNLSKKCRNTKVDHSFLRKLYNPPRNYKRLIGVERTFEKTIEHELYSSLNGQDGYVSANAIFKTNNDKETKLFHLQDIETQEDIKTFMKDIRHRNNNQRYSLEWFNAKNISAIIVLNRHTKRLYLDLSGKLKKRVRKKKWPEIKCNGKKYTNVALTNCKLNTLTWYTLTKKPCKNTQADSKLNCLKPNPSSILDVYSLLRSYRDNKMSQRKSIESVNSQVSTTKSDYKIILEIKSDHECDHVYHSYFSNQNCMKNVMSKVSDFYSSLFTRPKSSLALIEDTYQVPSLPMIRNDNFVYVVSQVNTSVKNNVPIRNNNLRNSNNSLPQIKASNTSKISVSKPKIQANTNLNNNSNISKVNPVSKPKIVTNQNNQNQQKQNSQINQKPNNQNNQNRNNQNNQKQNNQLNQKRSNQNNQNRNNQNNQKQNNQLNQKRSNLNNQKQNNQNIQKQNNQKPNNQNNQKQNNQNNQIQNALIKKQQEELFGLERFTEKYAKPIPVPVSINKLILETDSTCDLLTKTGSPKNKLQAQEPIDKEELLKELKENFNNLNLVMAMDKYEPQIIKSTETIKSNASFTSLDSKEQLNIIFDLMHSLKKLTGLLVDDETKKKEDSSTEKEIQNILLPTLPTEKDNVTYEKDLSTLEDNIKDTVDGISEQENHVRLLLNRILNNVMGIEKQERHKEEKQQPMTEENIKDTADGKSEEETSVSLLLNKMVNRAMGTEEEEERPTYKEEKPQKLTILEENKDTVENHYRHMLNQILDRVLGIEKDHLSCEKEKLQTLGILDGNINDDKGIQINLSNCAINIEKEDRLASEKEKLETLAILELNVGDAKSEEKIQISLPLTEITEKDVRLASNEEKLETLAILEENIEINAGDAKSTEKFQIGEISNLPLETEKEDRLASEKEKLETLAILEENINEAANSKYKEETKSPVVNEKEERLTCEEEKLQTLAILEEHIKDSGDETCKEESQITGKEDKLTNKKRNVHWLDPLVLSENITEDEEESIDNPENTPLTATSASVIRSSDEDGYDSDVENYEESVTRENTFDDGKLYKHELYKITEYEETTDNETNLNSERTSKFNFETTNEESTPQDKTQDKAQDKAQDTVSDGIIIAERATKSENISEINCSIVEQKSSNKMEKRFILEFNEDTLQQILNSGSIDSLRDIINGIKLIDKEAKDEAPNTVDVKEMKQIEECPKTSENLISNKEEKDETNNETNLTSLQVIQDKKQSNIENIDKLMKPSNSDPSTSGSILTMTSSGVYSPQSATFSNMSENLDNNMQYATIKYTMQEENEVLNEDINFETPKKLQIISMEEEEEREKNSKSIVEVGSKNQIIDKKMQFILEPKQNMSNSETSIEVSKQIQYILKQNLRKMQQRHRFLVSLLDDDIKKMNKLSVKQYKPKNYDCLPLELRKQIEDTEEQPITKFVQLNKDMRLYLTKMKQREEDRKTKKHQMLKEKLNRLTVSEYISDIDLESEENEEKMIIQDVSENDIKKKEQPKTNSEPETKITEKESQDTYSTEEPSFPFLCHVSTEINFSENTPSPEEQKSMSESILPNIQKHISALKTVLKEMKEYKQEFLPDHTQDLLKKLNIVLDSSLTKISETSTNTDSENIGPSDLKDNLCGGDVETTLGESLTKLKGILENHNPPPVIEKYKYCPIRYEKSLASSECSAFVSECHDFGTQKTDEISQEDVSESTLNTEPLDTDRKTIEETDVDTDFEVAGLRTPEEIIRVVEPQEEETIIKKETICKVELPEVETIIQEEIIYKVEPQEVETTMKEETAYNVPQEKEIIMTEETAHPVSTEEKTKTVQKVRPHTPIKKHKSVKFIYEAIQKQKEGVAKQDKNKPKTKETGNTRAPVSPKNKETTKNKDLPDVNKVKKTTENETEKAIISKQKIEENLKKLDEMVKKLSVKKPSTPKINKPKSLQDLGDKEDIPLPEIVKMKILQKLKIFSGTLQELKEEKKRKLLTPDVEQSIKVLDIIPEEKLLETKTTPATKPKTKNNQSAKDVNITKENRIALLKQLNKTLQRVSSQLSRNSVVIEKVNELKHNMKKMMTPQEIKQYDNYAYYKQFSNPPSFHAMNFPYSNSVALTKQEITKKLQNSLLLLKDLNEVVKSAKVNPVESLKKLSELEVALGKQQNVPFAIGIPTKLPPAKNYIKKNIEDVGSNASLEKQRLALGLPNKLPSAKNYIRDNITKVASKAKLSANNKSTPNIKRISNKSKNMTPRICRSTNVKNRFLCVSQTECKPKAVDKRCSSKILPKITTTTEISFAKRNRTREQQLSALKINQDNKPDTPSALSNIMPHLTVDSFRPIHSEYPRKDNLDYIDVERTYLYKIVNNKFSESYIEPLVKCYARNRSKSPPSKRKKDQTEKVDEEQDIKYAWKPIEFKDDVDVGIKDDVRPVTPTPRWTDDVVINSDLRTSCSQTFNSKLWMDGNYNKIAKQYDGSGRTSLVTWKNLMNCSSTILNQNKSNPSSAIEQKAKWIDMGPNINNFIDMTKSAHDDSKKSTIPKKSEWRDMHPKNPKLYVKPLHNTPPCEHTTYCVNLPESNMKEKYEAWRRLCDNTVIGRKGDANSSRPQSSRAASSKPSLHVKVSRKFKTKYISSESSNSFQYGVLEKKSKSDPYKVRFVGDSKKTKLKKSKHILKKKIKSKSSRK